ncbi:MAG: ubiquinone-dependent pyruvate dehydrogenase [Muribaculaceae bacterium]|nr:ubiquinone-dependent pyruvate dehydrogenase [Muribaculaceae bacterium]
MKNTGNPTPNVAQKMVEQLVESGVERIYAITGDSLNALTDAINKDGRIKFIHVRNEEAAAFAASAEAQLTGKLAVCAGSSGPGHVHLINGLYDAQRSNAPVLALASTCASSMFGTGYFQETNPTLLFSNCSVYNEMAITPSQVPSMLHGAMQEAISKGGVGVVGLPADVITEPATTDSASTIPSYTTLMPIPSEEEIQESVNLINSAKKIAIFVGMGASESVSSVRELADKLKAPLITTYKSQMEMTRNMPNYVGHMGYLGMWSAENAVSDADLVIILGTNFPYPGFFPTDKSIIQVDIRAERLGKRAKLKLGIRSDSKAFIEAILQKVNKKTDSEFLKKALSDYAEIKNMMKIPVDNPGKEFAIRPEFMLATLDRLAEDDCIVTVDTGMNNVWTSHYLTSGKSRKMIGSFTHGSMANALPMAIGAACSRPDRQVISISGDGGLAMLMGELLTIAQYKLPVKILGADNRALAFVKWEMELADYSPSEVNLLNPDFGEMARTMGFFAETVTKPENLEEAMKRWLNAEGPALLSVTTDTNAASFTFSKDLMHKATPENVISNFMVPGV